MATVTKSFDFDYAFAPFGQAEAKPAPRRGFWNKVFAAMIESRRLSAERELRRHSALLQRIENLPAKRDLPF